MTNKTLNESIAILQAQNVNIIKLVEMLTSGTPEVANHTNPSKYEKPPWDPTGY